MPVLHHLRSSARDAAILLLAQRQASVNSLAEADDRCRSFGLDKVLDTWIPTWTDQPPPPQMGPMARKLTALTYCVFVGVWESDVGFMLQHPEELPPKSVTTAFTTREDEALPRAHLAVRAHNERVLVPF